MGIRELVRRLIAVEHEIEPRTPEALQAVLRKRTIEQRVKRLETDLAAHVRKPSHLRTPPQP